MALEVLRAGSRRGTLHTSTPNTEHVIPHVVQTSYKNCHNWRPMQQHIVSLESTTDDVIEPAAGILILGTRDC